MKYKKKLARLAGRIKHWETMQKTMRPEEFKSFAGNKPGSVNK